MKTIRIARSVIFAVIAVTLCCGCSSGGGTPVDPGMTSGSMTPPRTGVGGSAEDNYQSDPRFEGYTSSKYQNEWYFPPDGPPEWAGPYFNDLEFDRFLKGWCLDPHMDLDPLTFTCIIDEKHDLYNNITYQVEILPDGSLMYHWKCAVPDDLKDNRRHLVEVRMDRFNGISLVSHGVPILKPFILPTIGALIYPWRDISLPVEEQKEDPLKILIFFDGDARQEWSGVLESPLSWNIEGLGNPVSIELEQMDSPWPIAVLNLQNEIEQNTTLTFGPVTLEKGLITGDSESICLGGGGKDGDLCWCGMNVTGIAHHDYLQIEDFAWAIEVSNIAKYCKIPVSDQGTVTMTPSCETDPFDLANWNLSGDQCQFGISETWDYTCALERGVNTSFYDGSCQWELNTQWIFTEEDCPDSGPRTIVISESFTNVDTDNPSFIEEPRLAYGPEAAEWWEGFWKPDDSNYHLGCSRPPDYYRTQECNVFLLVHVKDEGDPAALSPGGRSVQLDILRNGQIDENKTVPHGGGIWIDNNPEWYDETSYWPDGNYNYEMLEDYKWIAEEFVVIFNIDSLLDDPDVEEVKVRVTDFRYNWSRSDNVLDWEGDEDDYTVMDLMFRDNNMYPHESCYHFWGPDDRREECDGYVRPRPGGQAALDVCAVVSAYDPPSRIEVELKALNDEPPPDESVSVYLYRLVSDPNNPSDAWLEIWWDSVCAGMVWDDCVEIYCRYEDDREFDSIPDPPTIVASDEHETTPVSDQPVDFTETPYLLVTSSDLLANNGEDLKDYSVALATGAYIDKLLNEHIFAVDGWIARNIESAQGFSYGAKRGWFENKVVNPENGMLCLNYYGLCSGLSNSYDNFKRNVLSFGFETVMAECKGFKAYYPVQSEADIMLVHCHGNVNTTNNKSYMRFFPEHADVDFFPEPQDETVIYASEWANPIPANGFLDIARDGEWLATTACWLLCTEYLDKNGVSYPNVNAWQDWQALVNRSDSLQSVLGWANIHWADTDPSDSSDAVFWQQFQAHLNEDPPHQADPDLWLNGNYSDELGVVCYMEAAWKWYHDQLDPGVTYTDPGWKKDFMGFMIDAAAVDSGHRYTLDPIDTPGVLEEDRPVKIVKH